MNLRTWVARNLTASLEPSINATNLSGNLDDSLGLNASVSRQRLQRASTAAASAASPDLLFRNVATGANRITSIGGSTLNLPSRDANWQVVGIDDFNRDGQEDVLWRNFSSGLVQIWQVKNAKVQSFDLSTVADFDWKTIAVGDFNSDGSPDILWQNSRTTEVGLWFLNGTQIDRTASIGTPGGAWAVQGAGDFNKDGSLDLVWRNTSSGENALWLLNKGVLNTGLHLDRVADLNWKIAGIGDFNGDRSSDLLWQNSQTGDVGVWLYNKTQVSRMASLPKMASQWQIIGTFDLNQDQRTDIIWRSATTGEVKQWRMNGATVTDTLTLTTEPDLNWQLVSVLAGGSRASTDGLSTTRNVAYSSANTLASAENQASPTFSRSSRVDATKSSDFYRINVNQSGVFTASLKGLSADADVRLVQDSNGNGTIDDGEVLAWQWERGTRDESIRRFLNPGTYYVQVLDYQGQTVDYSVSTNFAPAQSDDQQFRIDLSFGDTLSGLTSAARDAINQAAKFWENAITSRSGITRSNTLTIALFGETLSYSDGTADTSTLALSGPTFSVDANDNLVIVRGSSTINARKFGDFNSNPIYLRDTMIHEFAHVLGFGTAWEPVQFTLSNGTTFTAGKNLINRANATYNANTYAGQAYGDFLGTSSPTAVPIEPQVFAHWDETRFNTELMTPFAESPGAPVPASVLTLAALRDLGWNVNFGAAQAYSLPAASATAASLSAEPQPTVARAAYKCGCSRCLAAVRTELPLPSLTEAVLSAA